MAQYDKKGEPNRSIGIKPVGRVRATPIRSFFDRYAMLGFIALSAGLLLFGRADNVVVEISRKTVTDVAAPLLSVLQEPMAAIENVGRTITNVADVYEENKRLRTELDRLRGWEGVATTLSDENRLMRDLLSMTDEKHTTVRSARVIADTSTPYVRAIVINAGSRDGIEKGQAALNHMGLVGRVEGTAQHASRVLLVTDINSRIPVRFADDRVKGLAVGTNGRLLQIKYLPENAQPTVGERIVTSGDGGLIPVGLPVGVVEHIDADGNVFVTPYVDLARLDYVRVMGLPLDATVETSGGLPRGVADPDAAAQSGVLLNVPVDILLDDNDAVLIEDTGPVRPTLRTLPHGAAADQP